MTYDLSVLIPARNEYYEEIDLLNLTVANVLANTSERTQVIAILDGYTPPQPLPASPRVTVVHHYAHPRPVQPPRVQLEVQEVRPRDVPVAEG
jgi:hypothetical protein